MKHCPKKHCNRLLCFNDLGAEVPLQVVPERIESRYGSNTTMGCASPLVQRGDVWVCDNSESYLVDGCSPAINTNSSNWASQLVTARKIRVVHGSFIYRGVVLTFDFDTPVFPDSIELDLFLCSQLKSDASSIYVFADRNSTLIFSSTSRFFGSKSPPRPSCDSLSTVRISLGHLADDTPNHSWHIVVDINLNNERAYVGEVRFLGSNIANHGKYTNPCMAYTCIPTQLQIQAVFHALATRVISTTYHCHVSLTDSHPTSYIRVSGLSIWGWHRPLVLTYVTA